MCECVLCLGGGGGLRGGGDSSGGSVQRVADSTSLSNQWAAGVATLPHSLTAHPASISLPTLALARVRY